MLRYEGSGLKGESGPRGIEKKVERIAQAIHRRLKGESGPRGIENFVLSIFL